LWLNKEWAIQRRPELEKQQLQDKSLKQFPNDWMILTNNQLVNHIRKKSMMDMFSVVLMHILRLERL
jgi:hypothetical protein